MTEKILIRVPEQLKAKILKETNQMGISMNALILQILWDWAKEKQKEG